ncbi:hypothetical protein HAX54_031699 [Datura stramonium]|uniref:Uncharacterized protein n=1 Tax=Datura stramonium TaxID=4076 RepID=A0ABS8VAB5_DATST|nr:hypothetical protein [Datura stramonium]
MSSPRLLLQASRYDHEAIPMPRHQSGPDHSATDQHPPPANPTTCSGMNRAALESCIRRQGYEQRIISNLDQGIDGDFLISQNIMQYDEIECNRNKDRKGVTYS